MTYDQLVAFTSVAAEGTFTGASNALHKSQPAVSKLIRNLEGELGVVLFDRTRYRATLTDSGRVFYERAAAVIESTHALRGFGLALGGKVEPIVRLAVEAVTPLDPSVKILRDVEARFPSVRFELHTERLAGAAEALRDRRADLVVATMLGIDAAKVDATPFARIRIVPDARADHQVATRRPPIQTARTASSRALCGKRSGPPARSPNRRSRAGAAGRVRTAEQRGGRRCRPSSLLLRSWEVLEIR